MTDKEIREIMWEVFPKKEEGYRPHQEDAILHIVRTFLEGRKFAVLEAPTGAGKSVIAYTAVRTIQRLDTGVSLDEEGNIQKLYSGPYGLISVHTRFLQHQYTYTLPDVPHIWSGAHYPCAVSPKDDDMYWGCGECPKKRCVKFQECSYAGALDNFLHADIAVTNYSYYLHAPFLQPYISVIDEAHNLEKVLCEWSKVELSTRYLNGLLVTLVAMKKIDVKTAETILGLIKKMIFIDDRRMHWLEDLRATATKAAREIMPLARMLEKELRESQKHIDNPRLLRDADRKYLQFLQQSSKYFGNLMQKLNPIRYLKTEWVISKRAEEESEGRHYAKVDIKPLYIDEVSRLNLFNQSKFFVFMSATICGVDTFLKYLGIEQDEATFCTMPSMFPITNRPVYAYTDHGSFNHENREKVRPEYTKFVDILLQTHFAGVRGVIHSVSYENAEFIKQHSTEAARMAFPDSEDLLTIVDLLQTRHDLVVVSPTVTEGLDLKDDLCRFVIFFKVPYQSLGDKWIKARCNKDSTWYAREAIIKIVQGSGRGTRSEDDHAITAILDEQFLRLWRNNRHLFPEWYQAAVEFIDHLGNPVTVEK